MSAMKIKKGDTVQVITGTDKGKEGKVVSVDAKNNKVVVEGVNMVSKHTKPNAQNQNGGIVRMKLQSMFLTLCMFTRERLQRLATSLRTARSPVWQNQPERLLIKLRKEVCDGE